MTYHITPERIAELLALDGYAPGPWSINEEDSLIVSESEWLDENGVKQRNLIYANVIGTFVDIWGGQANARVMAAAPDLHAALAQVNAENERLRKALDVLMSFSISDPGFEYSMQNAIREISRNHVAAKRKARAALNPENDDAI